MTKRFALALGLLFLNAGCAHSAEAQTFPDASHETNVANQLPLEADALRDLLAEAYVTPVRPPDVLISHPPGEVFRSQGVYERIVGRQSIEGTFYLRDNTFCVRGEGIPLQCRQIIALRDDTYSLMDVSDGTMTLVTITPLR